MTYTRVHGTRDCKGMSTNANGNGREYIILCSWANSQMRQWLRRRRLGSQYSLGGKSKKKLFWAYLMPTAQGVGQILFGRYFLKKGVSARCFRQNIFCQGGKNHPAHSPNFFRQKGHLVLTKTFLAFKNLFLTHFGPFLDPFDTFLTFLIQKHDFSPCG